MSVALADAGAVSMVFDSSGVLHAAWYDSAQRDLVYATRDSGGAWSVATTVDAGQAVGSQLSLALDGAGQPGIAYYDAADGNLKYAHLAGAGWSTSVIDAKGDVGRNPSLAFDSSGHPLISYYDATHRSLRVATFVKNRPRIATIASGASAGQFSNIAVNPLDGTFGVTFESTARRQVRLVKGKAGHLSQNVIATLPSTANGSAMPALEFDAMGDAAVSFIDPSSGSLFLSRPGKRTWTNSAILTGADAQENVHLSFAAGQPRVLYSDQLGDVCLASFSDGTWTSAGAGGGSSSNSAVDPTSGAIAVVAAGTINQVDPMLAAPASLSANAVSESEVDLTWTEASPGATGFVVQRAIVGGAFWTIATIGNVLTFVDSTVAQGTPYTYRLYATDAAGGSLSSTSANATTPSDAPTNFTAQISFDYAPWIELSWTDNAIGETGYRVERATDGTHFLTIDILPPDSTDYLDTLESDEQTYTYRVTPFDGSGDRARSADESVMTGVAAPTQLQAIVVSQSQVNLSWTNVSTSADHLEIDCIVNGVNATVATNLPATANTYSVTNLADGTPLAAATDYTFYVIAERGTDAASSNPADTVTGFDSPPHFMVDSIASDQIGLTWGDVLGESGYEIQWSPDNTNFTTLTTTAADVTQYTVTGLTENTAWHFRIRALGAGGDSTFLWYALPTTELAPPTDLAATPLPGGSIRLDWSDVSSAATSYEVTIAQGGGTFGNPIDLPANSTSTIITAGPNGLLQPGVAYRFRVIAMTADNQSVGTEIEHVVSIA